MKNRYHLYVIHMEGHYKIGHTQNIEGRLSSIQTGSPFKADLLFSWGYNTSSESRGIEKQLHNRFSQQRVRGEWFKLSGEDLDELISFAPNEIGVKDVELPELAGGLTPDEIGSTLKDVISKLPYTLREVASLVGISSTHLRDNVFKKPNYWNLALKILDKLGYGVSVNVKIGLPGSESKDLKTGSISWT